MNAQQLADPTKHTDLEPTFPVSIDTDFQNQDWGRFTNPKLAERIIKLHGLFATHLVISEPQVLDHLALRYFLLDFNSYERGQAISYLTTPYLDGLGPVVLASEAYDKSDPRHAFPLKELLRRKLGLDELKRTTTWEMSSFDPGDRDTLNRTLKQIAGEARLTFVLEHLEPRGRLDEYLEIASLVWDERAGTTRLPSKPLSLGYHLAEELSGFIRTADADRIKEAAMKLQKMASDGKIKYEDGREADVQRSGVRPWFREEVGPRGPLDALLNKAWCRAFVNSLPGRCGWVNTCEPPVWKTAEPYSKPRPKRPLSNVLGMTAEDTLTVATGGPLMLDRLSLAELGNLRQAQELSELSSASPGGVAVPEHRRPQGGAAEPCATHLRAARGPKEVLKAPNGRKGCGH